MADPNTPGQNPLTPGFGDTGEPWALEDTLKKVLQVLQKDVQQGARQGRNFDALNRNVDRLIRTIDRGNTSDSDGMRREIANSTQSRKALEDLQRTTRRSLKAQEEINRNQKQSKNAARDNLLNSGGGMGGGRNLISSFIKGAASKTLDTLSGAAKGILNSGGDFQNAMQGVASSLPGIMGTVLGGAVGMVNQARDQIAQISQTGQTFNGNLIEFSNAASMGAVSMTQATEILANNSEAAAKIGGANFLRLQRQVRTTTEMVGRYGLSVSKQADIAAEFYLLQMSRGRVDQAKNAAAMADFTGQMAALSKLTGKSIDQLVATQKALVTDAGVYAAVQRIAERFGVDAANNAQKLIDTVIPQFDEATQTTLKDMFVSLSQFGSINQSDLGLALSRANREDLIPVLEKALTSGNETEIMSVLRSIGQEGMAVNSSIRKVTSNIQVGFKDQQAITSAFGSFAAITDEQVAGREATQKKLEEELAKGQKGTGGIAAIDRQDTINQEKMGQVYSQMLAKATELYPAIGKLTEASLDVTSKLLGSESLSAAITKTTEALTKMANDIPRILNSFESLGAIDSWIAKTITAIADLGAGFGKLTGIGEGLGSVLALLTTAATVSLAWTKGKQLLSAGATKVGSTAANAGRRAFGRGAGRAVGTAAAEAGEGIAARTAARSAPGLLGKLGAGTVGRMIPGIGLVVGGIDAYNRAKEGDYLGAGLSGAGAIASTLLPGIGGLVAGVAPVVVNGIRDYMGQTPASKEEQAIAKSNPKANEAEFHKTRMSNQVQAQNQRSEAIGAELAEIRKFYQVRLKMEREFFNAQIKLASIRDGYERTLISNRYGSHIANKAKETKAQTSNADALFRTQVEQAKRVRSSMDGYQAKAKRMGALNNTGVIVQPTIGDDIGSKQLQEQKLTNQFLYNIYENGRAGQKFRPLVTMYQTGL